MAPTRRRFLALSAGALGVGSGGAAQPLTVHTFGDSILTHTIEPSLRGASEVRRAILPLVLPRG
jgi:hypothetical protein